MQSRVRTCKIFGLQLASRVPYRIPYTDSPARLVERGSNRKLIKI